ncbi:MAG TPA: hypothetical protein VFV47_14530 [Hyphomicrobiaceae bacterium]|nr:hypothetical protein [Hyphomicrobiaceae bacterium]
MRQLMFAVMASMLAAPLAIAADLSLPAEDVIARLSGNTPEAERDAWFDATAKDKTVAWAAPVFNVTTAFDTVLVNTRVGERGLIACEVPKRLEAKAKKAIQGERALCVGRIEGYERLMGAALINIAADDFIVGEADIAAWEKKKGGK